MFLFVQLKDNSELKELVLYLDEERESSQRAQGDGSSGTDDNQTDKPNSKSLWHVLSSDSPKVSEEIVEQYKKSQRKCL